VNRRGPVLPLITKLGLLSNDDVEQTFSGSVIDERRLPVLCRAGLLDGAGAGNVAAVRGRVDTQPGWLPVVTRACRTVRPAAEPAAEQTDRIGDEDCPPASVVTVLAGAADVFPVGA
jgi:hypothetical protein